MDMFDFFFPEQAEAKHLRTISQQLAASNRVNARGAQIAQNVAADVAGLRKDLEFLTMVLLAIVKRMSETQLMSMADLADILKQVDGMDGEQDGGLDVGILRGMLGVLRQPETPKPGVAPPTAGVAPPRLMRYRR
jgi:hypothetical protein